jgi:hypothetical protein
MNENKIIYHFPKLNSKKIQSTGTIQYYMIGKENNPNISYKKRSSNIHYISNKLYICAKNETSGQLIIENIPVTNTDKKLFLCIPLITKTYNITSGQNQLDNIIQDTIENIDNGIYLDDVLPEDSECEISETRFAITVEFKTPIYVYSYFTGLTTNSGLPELMREQNMIEPEKTNIVAFKQKSISCNKIDDTTTYSHSLNVSVLRPTTLEHKVITMHPLSNSKIETFVEGMDDNPYTWMECDTAELDYSGEVPTFSTPLDANTENTTEKRFNTILIIMYVVISLIFTVFFLPLIYKTIILDFIMPRFAIYSTFIPEIAFILILVIISIILLAVGGSNLPNNFKTGMDELTAGGTIMGFTFVSIIIMMYYKNFNPSYLGENIKVENGFSILRNIV